MKPGTQIAYIPTHANGNIEDPSVEFGFVASSSRDGSDSYFCRYWVKNHPGMLRTIANSELTPKSNLIEYRSVPQELVNTLIEGIAAVSQGKGGQY